MTWKSGEHLCMTYGNTGQLFSVYGNSIHNKIPLLKKENVDLYPFPWGHNNYADVYF